MPHDHGHHQGHGHGHGHSHGHGHGHGHGHHHAHSQAAGHNRAADHLHSHMAPEDRAADLQVLAAQFIDGFRQAADKTAFLRLAGVPFERPGQDGPESLKLVDVQLSTEWQVGTAAPSFGSRELSYLPFPGQMVRERTNMGFVYVSMSEKSVIDLRSFLVARMEGS